MKIIKGNIEIISLRKEMDIEKLKLIKKQVDKLNIENIEYPAYIERVTRIIDTAIFYHAKWKQEKQKNEELTALNRELVELLKRAVTILSWFDNYDAELLCDSIKDVLEKAKEVK